MTTFALPLQTAIYNRLTTGSISANVFDSTPNLPAGMPFDSFPYVTIGEDHFTPNDTDDKRGVRASVYLHIWSRYDGKKECKEIMKEIDDLLNRQAGSLSATGYRFIDVILEFSNIIDETDGETVHGVLRYRATIREDLN